jgi:hypothetical protein
VGVDQRKGGVCAWVRGVWCGGLITLCEIVEWIFLVFGRRLGGI